MKVGRPGSRNGIITQRRPIQLLWRRLVGAALMRVVIEAYRGIYVIEGEKHGPATGRARAGSQAITGRWRARGGGGVMMKRARLAAARRALHQALRAWRR